MLLRCAGRVSYSTILIAELLILSMVPAFGSDVGGEVEPPPCEFDNNGSVISGVPACSGPMAFKLIMGTGTLSADITSLGSADQPWRLNQDAMALDSTINLSGGFGPLLPFDPAKSAKTQANPTDSGHWFARVLQLTVINSTSIPWQGFDLELRSVLDTPSDHLDSISFGQIQRNPPLLFMMPFSDVFGTVSFEARTKDSIRFREGIVRPGESVSMQFLISDNGPTSEFFLQEQAVELVPEPGTLSVVSFVVLAAAAFRRWRR